MINENIRRANTLYTPSEYDEAIEEPKQALSIDANHVGALNIQEGVLCNKALRSFSDLGLEKFERWYDVDTIIYLSFLNVDSGVQLKAQCCLKYVFFDEKWEEQLQGLVLLKSSFSSLECNKTVCFISKEPGAGQNHYIFGFCIESNLLIINPIGITKHKDFYQSLGKLQSQNIFDNIYISNVKIQRDPDGLVSCGPICVELMKRFASLADDEVMQVLSDGVKMEKEAVKFTVVDIKGLLPDSLGKLCLISLDVYQEGMVNLRKLHCSTLRHVEGSIDEQNRILEACLNTPEQVLMKRLVLDKDSILKIEQQPEYLELIKEFLEYKGEDRHDREKEFQGERKRKIQQSKSINQKEDIYFSHVERAEMFPDIKSVSGAQFIQKGKNMQRSGLKNEESTAVVDSSKVFIKDSVHYKLRAGSINLAEEYKIEHFLDDQNVIALAQHEYSLLSGQAIEDSRQELKLICILDSPKVENWSLENKAWRISQIQNAISSAINGLPQFFIIADGLHIVSISLLPDASMPRGLKIIYMNSAYGNGSERYISSKMTGLMFLKELEVLIQQSNNPPQIEISQIYLNPTQQVSNNCGVMTAFNIAELAAYWKSKSDTGLNLSEFDTRRNVKVRSTRGHIELK